MGSSKLLKRKILSWLVGRRSGSISSLRECEMTKNGSSKADKSSLKLMSSKMMACQEWVVRCQRKNSSLATRTRLRTQCSWMWPAWMILLQIIWWSMKQSSSLKRQERLRTWQAEPISTQHRSDLIKNSRVRMERLKMMIVELCLTSLIWRSYSTSMRQSGMV